MKYIILEVEVSENLKMHTPVIFAEELIHADVAAAVIKSAEKGNPKVISAGRCHVAVTGVGDGSISLGIKSRKGTDETLINSIDYTHGFVY